MSKDELVWEIYHLDAEFARINGDPLIGKVMACTKEEAEAKAVSGQWMTKQGTGNAPTGFWAFRKK